MIRTFLRPTLVKRFNVRTKCDLNCKDGCVEQTNHIKNISKNTDIIATITIINFLVPFVHLINKIYLKI